MEVAVYNKEGQDTGRKVSLSDSIFGIEPNDHAIYLAVKQFLANQRQGTHMAKERWAIARSTRKIKRQKGTGGARAGSLKSPVFVGGGRVFGPKPRDYSFKLNKKVKELARLSALSYKAKEGALLVMEDFAMEAPKTKQFAKLLQTLPIQNKRSLFVLDKKNEGDDVQGLKNIYLSSRNIERTKVMMLNDLNTYAVLEAGVLVLSESALQKIQEKA